MWQGDPALNLAGVDGGRLMGWGCGHVVEAKVNGKGMWQAGVDGDSGDCAAWTSASELTQRWWQLSSLGSAMAAMLRTTLRFEQAVTSEVERHKH